MKKRRNLEIAEIVKIHTLKRAGVPVVEIQKRFNLKTRRSVYEALKLRIEDLV